MSGGRGGGGGGYIIRREGIMPSSRKPKVGAANFRNTPRLVDATRSPWVP